MKRLTLYSFLTAAAVVLGVPSQAEAHKEVVEINRDSLTMAQGDDAAEGIISPDDDGPNNRDIPDGDSAIEDATAESEEPELTDGIISLDDDGPNNRDVPDGDSAIEDAPFETEDPDLTDGVISPDDDGPNNRAVPES